MLRIWWLDTHVKHIYAQNPIVARPGRLVRASGRGQSRIAERLHRTARPECSAHAKTYSVARGIPEMSRNRRQGTQYGTVKQSCRARSRASPSGGALLDTSAGKLKDWCPEWTDP